MHTFPWLSDYRASDLTYRTPEKRSLPGWDLTTETGPRQGLIHSKSRSHGFRPFRVEPVDSRPRGTGWGRPYQSPASLTTLSLVIRPARVHDRPVGPSYESRCRKGIQLACTDQSPSR
jgi:hypothetical protein